MLCIKANLLKAMKITQQLIIRVLISTTFVWFITSPMKVLSQDVLTQEDFDHIPQGCTTRVCTNRHRNYRNRHDSLNHNDNRLNHHNNRLNHDSGSSSYGDYYDNRFYPRGNNRHPDTDWVEKTYVR